MAKTSLQLQIADCRLQIESFDRIQILVLDICGQFEKKMSITGRDSGVTGEEFTKYLLSWIENPSLKNRWQEEVTKLKK